MPPELRTKGTEMLSCDYNGWNDAPEEEREWFDTRSEIWTGSLTEREHATVEKDATSPLTSSSTSNGKALIPRVATGLVRRA
jgi:hypothetical protein